MNTVIERGALVLLSLPTLMYASGCLLVTADFVAMIPVDLQPLGVHVFVLGLALLASATLIHVKRFRFAAGIALAVCMMVTAFCVHLPTLFVAFPPEMGGDMVELAQRTAMAGVVKDLGLAGAGLLAALLGKARQG